MQSGTQQAPTPSSVIVIHASTLPGLLHVTADREQTEPFS
jgi:hypothetical protein